MLKSLYYTMGAALTTGMLMSSSEAFAQTGGRQVNDIAQNINDSLSNLPGLVTSISYLVGVVLGVLGVMKIKDHVENPSQTQLKDGAIRLGAGGALFALPLIMEAMLSTIGEGGTGVDANAMQIRGLDMGVSN